MYALVRRPHGSRSALLHVYLPPSAAGSAVSSRQIAFLARVIRGALKIRYLLLGGAIGGGYQLNKTYEEWREAVPDMSWMKEYFPDTEKTAALGASLRSFSTKMGDIIGDMQLNVDASWKDRQGERVSGWKDWFTSRWEQARRAAEEGEDDTRQHHHEVEPPEGPIGEDENLGEEGLPLLLGPAVSLPVLPSPSLFTVHAASSSFASPEERTQGESLREKLSSLERELREAQLKHRKEMEKLERENRELRKQMLLRKARDGKQYKELKKSLIDMYSEVLDDLSGYDAAAYNAQDHLPRVVVVGDQSSGKTSVLEMIAQARIFPRSENAMNFCQEFFKVINGTHHKCCHHNINASFPNSKLPTGFLSCGNCKQLFIRMNSLDPACNELKHAYDACFNKWFAEKFLRGVTDDSECSELLKSYRACVRKAIENKGLDLGKIEEDVLGTDKERTKPKTTK
ncbi:unnamed protein product [Cyprideis torosa]|uniref:Uncharacterized protein n=1 Tax=Cyprideis torosa TaxID=163714 RepID=A0A7R8WDF0_9CRUS|nr:unnamed protein product [Cyprideis torosa]CAG0894545.1 unnamed protein product [Cyprideis torosa]